jgi:peptidoglycan/LPS O-acetylase OafA/YrhL
MIVFLGHLGGQRMTGGLAWQIGPYMTQAVTIFFVLSGFVIGFVTDKRETDPVTYTVNRLSRIYSVAAPTVMITFLFDFIGRDINAGAYSSVWGYHEHDQIWQFLASIVFINQLWFIDVVPGSDLPYWSLGYELWYYVIFGLMLFTRRPRLWCMLTMLLVGPAVLCMFPLWLLGWGVYRTAKLQIGVAAGFTLWIGAAVGWLGYELWAARHGRLIGNVPDFLRRPELVEDYLVGILFAVHLAGFRAVSVLVVSPISRIAPLIQWAAGLTFTLYLLHLPVAQLLTAASPWPHGSLQNRVLVLGGTFMTVVLVAALTERQKSMWRRGFTILFARWSRARDARIG